jgi:hypothetical protein
MGMLNVPFWPPLVHLRVQVLQAQDVPSMHQQSLTPTPHLLLEAEVTGMHMIQFSIPNIGIDTSLFVGNRGTDINAAYHSLSKPIAVAKAKLTARLHNAGGAWALESCKGDLHADILGDFFPLQRSSIRYTSEHFSVLALDFRLFDSTHTMSR